MSGHTTSTSISHFKPFFMDHIWVRDLRGRFLALCVKIAVHAVNLDPVHSHFPTCRLFSLMKRSTLLSFLLVSHGSLLSPSLKLCTTCAQPVVQVTNLLIDYGPITKQKETHHTRSLYITQASTLTSKIFIFFSSPLFLSPLLSSSLWELWHRWWAEFVHGSARRVVKRKFLSPSLIFSLPLGQKPWHGYAFWQPLKGKA
jgi:hypothetical protein